MPWKLFALSILAGLAVGCAHAPWQPAAVPVCAGLDWWEAGRTDGVSGLPPDKLKSYECSATPEQIELYMNGREAGLVDFCSPGQALAVGRSGGSYSHVCPENLEPSFLANYETGLRIHRLEQENADLQGRIENLVHLLQAAGDGKNLKTQIENLRTRRSQNSGEIVDLESNSISF